MDKSPTRPPIPPSPAEPPADAPVAAQSAFIPSEEAIERRSRRWRWIGLGLLTVLAVAAVGVMVYWPRFKPKPPRQRDAVERVAGSYLDALTRQDDEAARKLGTIEEPPGIRSVRGVVRQKAPRPSAQGVVRAVGDIAHQDRRGFHL